MAWPWKRDPGTGMFLTYPPPPVSLVGQPPQNGSWHRDDKLWDGLAVAEGSRDKTGKSQGKGLVRAEAWDQQELRHGKGGFGSVMEVLPPALARAPPSVATGAIQALLSCHAPRQLAHTAHTARSWRYDCADVNFNSHSRTLRGHTLIGHKSFLTLLSCHVLQQLAVTNSISGRNKAANHSSPAATSRSHSIGFAEQSHPSASSRGNCSTVMFEGAYLLSEGNIQQPDPGATAPGLKAT
eukprot:77892-Pelagomonas_calceolata.AAC.4